MRWIVRYAMTAMLPSSASMPGVDQTDIDGFLKSLQREAPALFKIALYLAACVFTFLPLITNGWPLPAFTMPSRWRDSYANRFASHRIYLIRQLAVILKTAAGMCWGMDPNVRRHLELKPYPADPGTFKSSDVSQGGSG